jgi:uncharacterized protein
VNSALYRGSVRHRRFAPVPHAFRFPLFLMYLDLDELPTLFRGRWLWSARRPAVAWFRRADYLGDPGVPLDRAVRDLVAARTGHRPAGPIRLLTHLRTLGFVMNPVSLYYCFAPGGHDVEAIVAEVTNTPWNERHAYVLRPDAAGGGRGPWRFVFDKAHHVSPFLAMALRYDWRCSAPGPRLVVHIENHSARGRLFDATLALRREPLTGGSLAAALVRYPWLTAQVAVGIYWQALRLWLKGAPFHAHPARRTSDVAAPIAR